MHVLLIGKRHDELMEEAVRHCRLGDDVTVMCRCSKHAASRSVSVAAIIDEVVYVLAGTSIGMPPAWQEAHPWEELA